jgi:hypothetical protein
MTDGEREKKAREGQLVERFFRDAGAEGEGWTRVEEDRERPDFIFERAGQRIGVEVTELLAPQSGRERAGERTIAEIVFDVVQRWIVAHGGEGADIDGHLESVHSRRSETDLLAAALEEHLRHHGAGLARDRGTMQVPFRFQWGVVTRIERHDARGRFTLFADPTLHRTTTTARERDWLERELLAAIRGKVHLAASYQRTHPLWLIVRNPYTHLATVSEETRPRIELANADCFERIYCHNLKMNTLDARPPQPVVLPLLSVHGESTKQ